MTSAHDIAARCWKEGTPFLVPSAVDYMRSVLRSDSRVFEWGAGASTIWFARNAAEVISVEHNREWYDRVVDRLDLEELNNVAVRFVEQSPPEPYAAIVDEYDFFDLILVDGRNRVMCIECAIAHVMPGGILVLDNSERERYAPGLDWLAGWERKDFFNRWMTSVFLKQE